MLVMLYKTITSSFLQGAGNWIESGIKSQEPGFVFGQTTWFLTLVS
jgi:hypothetical protein